MDCYCKCGATGYVLNLFDTVSQRSVISWNPWKHYCRMHELGFDAEEITYGSVISASAALRAPPNGMCFRANGYVRAGMIDLLAKNHRFDDALRVFRDVSCENVVCWNAIIAGAVRNGENQIALDLFRQLCRHGTFLPNSFTFPCVLTACAMLEDLETGKMVQGWIIKCGDYDVYINTSLSDLYAKCKDMEGAMKIFTRMCLCSVDSWTAMISGFVQLDDYISAVLLQMRNPNNHAIMISLHAQYCTSSLLSVVNALSLGRPVHSHVIKSGLVFDVLVASSLFTMYSKWNNNVSWTSMIAGFAKNNLPDEAVRLFRNMLLEGNSPDQSTFIAILTAICSLKLVHKGKEVHAKVLQLGFGEEITVGGALVMMYSRCGYLKLARRLLDLLPLWDDVACSSMISGYAQNGYIEEALLMFHKMLMANFAVDSFSISSVVQAVTLTNRLDIGTQLQSYAMKVGLDSNVAVGSSLVAMYSKFGGINECVKAYDQTDAPDIIGWTTMIMSYARHGIGEEALKFFELMKREKMRPDPVTFVGVIEPNYRHYACMVDLLGRSGRLKEAERFISNMPIKPNALVWETLLAACKLHGDIELGKLAAKKITECEPSDAGAYISLSNIYADMGQWGEVMNIRSSMKGAKVKKEPGWSVV
ncbi:hypothetical protein ACJRO7_009841 [Eucalyptus globulus]|uniref:Pentatricopeptide repeat-containing protein n=1 Tax=Eucalyptus globulus TaxID=34317 RepID=A0ABD3LA34_EUCGL